MHILQVRIEIQTHWQQCKIKWIYFWVWANNFRYKL